MYLNKYFQKTTAKLCIALVTSKNFIIFLFKRLQSDMIFRVSSSLSYTSLIAIVPLLAVGLAIFSAFPVFSEVKEQLQSILLQNLVPDIEQEVSFYINEFISATAKLTAMGVVGIVVTAILLLSTIENSLNFIFKVYKSRNIKTKITLYWTVITLGPLLLGAGFSMRGYVYTLQKFMPDYFISAEFYLSTIIPTFFTLLALILLYMLVPNKKVKLSNAFAGALVAVFLFYIMRQIFGHVMSFGSTYTTLYGALAAIPLMLIWLYLIWVVVIFGAVVTAALGEYREKEENAEESKPEQTRHKKIKHYAKKFLPKEQK